MPVINYSPNIPQPTDRPSQSQPLLLQNFTGINDIWDVNHYQFADANAGKHKFSSMVLQVAAPAAVNDEFQIYTLNDAVSTHDELYIRRSANNTQSPNVQIPFTARGGNIASGFTWLPSGLLVKWGSFQKAAGTTVNAQAQNYPVAATTPVFAAAPFYVNMAASTTNIGAGIDPNAVVYFQSSTAAAMTYRIMQRRANLTAITVANTIYWVAIGRGV